MMQWKKFYVLATLSTKPTEPANIGESISSQEISLPSMAPLKLWNIHIKTYHLFWDTPKLEKPITKYIWLALKLSPTKIRGTVSSSALSIKSYVKGQATAHHFRVSGVRVEGVELSSSFPQSQCMTTVQKTFMISPGHTGAPRE